MVDALCDLGWEGRFTAARRRLQSRSGRPAPLGGDSLEFVGGDRLGAPGHLDRLDVREQAAESGAADAERLGGLAARVGESFDVARLAHDHPRPRGGR